MRALHPLAPDIKYQQNHCRIYRMDRQEGTWLRFGEHMPEEVGDIGFPLVLHRAIRTPSGSSRWTARR
jgi:hypothetical protein